MPEYIHNNCSSCGEKELKYLNELKELLKKDYSVELEDLKEYYLNNYSKPNSKVES